MKINISKNRRTFFFYLILADFVIAVQIAAASFLPKGLIDFSDNWASEIFMLSFASAFLVFMPFSGIFKNSKRIKSVIRPGLIFMILGSLLSFFASNSNMFIFGRTICGLGAGMMIVGQIGIIWHEDFKRNRLFSPAVLGALILGLTFGPSFLIFFSGPALSVAKLSFLLGAIFPALVLLEIVTEIFVTTCNVTFDATGAFFDIDSSDDIDVRTRKVAATTLRRAVYVFFDYWLSILSAGLVGVLNYWGMSFWNVALITWLFDFIVAALFLLISERSGHDITLGESFRRAVDAIRANSQLAGLFLFGYLVIKAIIWDGPEQIVVFFRKEIGTMTRMTMMLVVLTFFQGIFWAWAYGLGYESVSTLIKNFL
jgi:MFS family permease